MFECGVVRCLSGVWCLSEVCLTVLILAVRTGVLSAGQLILTPAARAVMLPL